MVAGPLNQRAAEDARSGAGTAHTVAEPARQDVGDVVDELPTAAGAGGDDAHGDPVGDPGDGLAEANGDGVYAAVATATAARGFLVSRWLGALLMLYSFTHLYVVGLRPGASVPRAMLVAGLALVLGSIMWWRSRTYAQRLDVPWGRRGQAAADLFAYTAIVFWLLFLVAVWLLSRGVAPF